MRFDKFTVKAQEAVMRGQELARQRDHSEITPMHLLASLLDEDQGVVSPGGVGFDINCGVRLLSSNLIVKDVRPKLRELVHQLFRDIPSGTGQSSRIGASTTDLKVMTSKAKMISSTAGKT